MAEIVGVIASVLTLTDAVAQAVRFAVELYKAPVELVALQREIAGFRDFVQAVDNASTAACVPQALQTELTQAREVIAELHKIIAEKLMTPKSSTCELRRIAWIKCKPEISRLRKRLKEVRDAVLADISAGQLTSLYRTERICQAILDVHMKDVPQLDTKRPLFQIPPQLNFSSAVGSSQILVPYDKTVMSLNGTPQVAHSQTLRERLILGKYTDFEKTPEPVGLLESLPSFRPETYTLDVSFPQMVIYAPYTLEANEFIRVNEFNMFYHAEPRRWVTITVTIAFSVDSKLWNLVPRSSPEGSFAAVRHSLPHSVNVALRTTLAKHRSIRHGSHFRCFVGGAESTQGSASVSHPCVQLSKPRFDSRSYLQKITLITHHWSVARYAESALDRRPVGPSTCRFAAWLGSYWVEETKFRTQKSAIDAQFYSLSACHALQNTTGHSQLLGLVIDDTGNISGFLRELPLYGNISKYILLSGHLVKPEQLWTWCEQLVRAVAEAHDAGILIGTLASFSAGNTGLNAELRVVLRRYTDSFERHHSEPARIPPEYEHSSTGTGKLPASAESDLYQLGLELWSIATRNGHPVASTFCQLAGCLSTDPPNCRELHANTSLLPWPDIEVPQYLKTAVAICRSKQPEDRWPAWKLLTLFPVSAAETMSTTAAEAPRAGALRSLPGIKRLENYTNDIWLRCDWCVQFVIKHHFHCNICSSSNFDVCPECFFTHGRHCYDDGHFLQERKMGYEIGGEHGKFYSSVMANGKREILEV